MGRGLTIFIFVLFKALKSFYFLFKTRKACFTIQNRRQLTNPDKKECGCTAFSDCVIFSSLIPLADVVWSCNIIIVLLAYRFDMNFLKPEQSYLLGPIQRSFSLSCMTSPKKPYAAMEMKYFKISERCWTEHTSRGWIAPRWGVETIAIGMPVLIAG